MMINNSALRRMAITNFNRSGPRQKKKRKKLSPAPYPMIYRRLDDD